MIHGALEIFNEVFLLNNNSHYLVGSGEKCNIRIQKDTIDHLHASFVVKDKIILIDLSSKNGTYLDENLLEKLKGIEITKSCILTFGKVSAILKLKSVPSTKPLAEISSFAPKTYGRKKFISATPEQAKRNESSTNTDSKNISLNPDQSFCVPETQFSATSSCSDDSDNRTEDLFGNVEDEFIRKNIVDLTKADEYYVPETQEYFTELQRNSEPSSKKRKAVLSNIDEFENTLHVNSSDLVGETFGVQNKSSENQSQNLFDDLALTQCFSIADIKSKSNREEIIDDEISRISWKNTSQVDNSNSSTPDIFEMNNDTSRPSNSSGSNSATPNFLIAEKPKVRHVPTQSASCSTNSRKTQSDVLEMPLTQKFVPRSTNFPKNQTTSSRNKPLNYDLSPTQPFFPNELLRTQVFPARVQPNHTVTKLQNPLNNERQIVEPSYPKELQPTQVFSIRSQSDHTVKKLPNPINKDQQTIEPSQSQLRPLGKNRYNVFSSSDDESTDDEKSKNVTESKTRKLEKTQKNDALLKDLLDIKFRCSPTLGYIKTPDIYSIRCIEYYNGDRKILFENLSPSNIFKLNDLKKKQTKNLNDSFKKQVNKVDKSTRILRGRSHSTIASKEPPGPIKKIRKGSLCCPPSDYTVDIPPKGKKKNKENEENVEKPPPKRSARIKNLPKKK